MGHGRRGRHCKESGQRPPASPLLLLIEPSNKRSTLEKKTEMSMMKTLCLLLLVSPIIDIGIAKPGNFLIETDDGDGSGKDYGGASGGWGGNNTPLSAQNPGNPPSGIDHCWFARVLGTQRGTSPTTSRLIIVSQDCTDFKPNAHRCADVKHGLLTYLNVCVKKTIIHV